MKKLLLASAIVLALSACGPSQQPVQVQYVQPQGVQGQPGVVVVQQPQQSNGTDMLAAGAAGYLLGSMGSRPSYSSPGYNSTTVVNKTVIVNNQPAPTAAVPAQKQATSSYKPSSRPTIASRSTSSFKASRR